MIIHKGFFTVTPLNSSDNRLVNNYYNKFSTFTMIYDFKLKRRLRKKSHTYAGYVKHLNQYRFSIGYVKIFMTYLKGMGLKSDDIDLEVKKYYDKKTLDINFKHDKYTPREEQKKYINALIDYSGYSNLVPLQTGGGKGLISIFSLIEINKRVAIVILPKYIEKWVNELKDKSDISDDDILVIQGNSSLVKAINNVKENKIDPKIVIFSNRTVMKLFKNFELNKTTYDFDVSDIMGIFNLSILLIDEGHQEFFSVFKNSLYLDAERLIILTATYETDNSTINSYRSSLVPSDGVLNFTEYKRYVTVYAISYELKTYRKVKYSTPQGYSHVEFEKSIMRRSDFLKSYIDMIKHYVEEGYYRRKKNNQTCLIFAATKKMCTIITEYLETLYPSLNVTRYVEDDPYDNLMDGDITVSTIISAGTAIDKKNLITVINTISVKSLTSNSQSLGRLRYMEGVDLRYYYLYTTSIFKHKEYHYIKMKQFSTKAKKMFTRDYGTTV